MAKIKVSWEIEDGYVGGSRLQTTVVNTLDYVEDDKEWNALDDSDKRAFIDEAVQQDFESKISFYIKNYGI